MILCTIYSFVTAVSAQMSTNTHKDKLPITPIDPIAGRRTPSTIHLSIHITCITCCFSLVLPNHIMLRCQNITTSKTGPTPSYFYKRKKEVKFGNTFLFLFTEIIVIFGNFLVSPAKNSLLYQTISNNNKSSFYLVLATYSGGWSHSVVFITTVPPWPICSSLILSPLTHLWLWSYTIISSPSMALSTFPSVILAFFVFFNNICNFSISTYIFSIFLFSISIFSYILSFLYLVSVFLFLKFTNGLI